MAQLRDGEGRLFTLYERVPAGCEWEVYEEVTAAQGVQLPNCGSLRPVRSSADGPTWPSGWPIELPGTAGNANPEILDGDGVLWDAESVDPSQ